MTRALGRCSALIAVVVLAACGSAASPSASVLPSPSPSPVVSSVPSPSEAPTPSPVPTPLPSVVITGELPRPEATVPPGYVVMPVGIEEFAATAMALGMDCGPTIRETGYAVGDYGLTCKGSDPAAHAEFSASVTFWTLDGLWLVVGGVHADTVTGSVTDSTLRARIVVPLAALFGGPAAGDWAREALMDPSCPVGGCKHSFGSVLLFVDGGSRGGASFYGSIAGQAFAGD